MSLYSTVKHVEQQQQLMQQRAASPRFVVTLDVADDSLADMDTIDADTLLARSSVSTRNVVRVKPQSQALSTLQEST